MENASLFALSVAVGALVWQLQHMGYRCLDISFILLTMWLLFCAGIVTYRMTFSPIAAFPGPILAAATFGYEFYYDLWPHEFRYMWKIRDLHEQYGPVVRINPIHLHILDHGASYDAIHPGDHRKKRDRCRWFSHYAKGLFLNGGLTQAMDHDFHRSRRMAIASLFSRKSVCDLQPLVKNKVQKLCKRLEEERKKEAVVNITDAMSALTMDIISAYCFGTDMRQLENPDFAAEWVYQLQEGSKVRAYARHFPWLINNLLRVPKGVMKWFKSDVKTMIDFENELQKRIQYIFDHPDEPSEEGHTTVFRFIMDSTLPPEEKTARRLAAEASTFVGAGTETTGRVLAVTAFHLIVNPEKLERLRNELETVMPSVTASPTLPELEKLPYLTAVAHEGLRLANGVSGRMPRVIRGESLAYKAEYEDGTVKEWVIPDGATITTSIYLLHHDEALFPDSHSFKPERWLDNAPLRQHLYAFARGKRGCLGQT